MAKGTGTYDDPILVDGLFTKTINGVKKFFKLKTGSVDTSNLVKKSGDTLNGNYFFSDGCNLYKTNKTSTLRLNASNDGKDGARLVLCGKDTKDYPAEFNLCANDGTSDVQLIGKANGELYWNNKNIVRTVNGLTADRAGNVTINTNTVKYLGTRTGNGTWTLTNVKQNTPLYILYNASFLGATASSNAKYALARIRAVSGTDNGKAGDSGFYSFFAVEPKMEVSGNQCFIVVPNSTTVTFSCFAVGDDDDFKAYQ